MGQHHRRPRADPADGSGAGGEAADPAHGLAYKLLLSPSGTKFGKSEDGDSVWLDPARTSPYAFYQYWLNTDDRDVGTYLRWFTELDASEIEALEAEAARAPEVAPAQRALARDITARTHGEAAATRPSPIPRRGSRATAIADPAVLASLYRVRRRVHVHPATLAAGIAVAPGRGRASSRRAARRAG